MICPAAVWTGRPTVPVAFLLVYLHHRLCRASTQTGPAPAFHTHCVWTRLLTALSISLFSSCLFINPDVIMYSTERCRFDSFRFMANLLKNSWPHDVNKNVLGEDVEAPLTSQLLWGTCFLMFLLFYVVKSNGTIAAVYRRAMVGLPVGRMYKVFML